MISNDRFPENFKLQNVRLLELRTEYTQYDLLGMAGLLLFCPNLETMILDHLHKIEEDVSSTYTNKLIKDVSIILHG